jgi:hypothetical protein
MASINDLERGRYTVHTFLDCHDFRTLVRLFQAPKKVWVEQASCDENGGEISQKRI